MNRLISPIIIAAAVVALLIAPASPVRAQSKPLLVVSLSGVDEIVNDIQYLMQLGGQAANGQIAAMMAAQYTQGLDNSRPISIVVSADGDQIKPLGMIPVKNLDQFLSIISQQTGEPRDVGDGIMEIAGPKNVYCKEQKGWAFVSDSKESLGQLPADPAAMLGDLGTKYDIGVRAVVKNIPEAYRQKWMDQMKQGMQSQLESADDGPLSDELRDKMMKAQMEQWETMFKETDVIEFGLNIDRKAQQMHIDVTTIAIPGTKTARSLAMLKNAESMFSGFVVDNAAVNMNLVREISETEVEQALTMLSPLREAAVKEIDEDADLPTADAKDAAKSLLNKLFAIIEATVKSGKIDGGAALLIENQTMTFLAGMQVADGAELEKTFKEMIEMAKQDPEFPGVKMDADKTEHARFHTMTVPIPEGEDARDVFGESLDVAVGIGAKSVYLSFGDNCLETLKGAIQKSSGGGSVSPFRLNVALRPILAMASSFDDNPMLSALADALKDHPGRDNVLITAKSVENGATYRMEVQDGIFKSLGSVNQGAAPAGANF